MKRLLLLFTFLSLSFSLFAQNYWEQTNGPVGGTIPVLAINSNGDIFAGTQYGGLYRSTDNGNNWTKINSGLPKNPYVLALAISFNGNIFAGCFNSIYLSTDNGDNWIQKNSGLGSSTINCISINGDGDIFAGTNGDGIYRSTNNGNNWTQVGFTNTEILSLAINSSGDIFVGPKSSDQYKNGIYRSTDNGNNWTQISTLNYLYLYTDESYVYSFTISSNGNIYAGAYNTYFSPATPYMFHSTDNGNTWNLTNSPINNYYANSLSINSNNYVFAGTDQGIFTSTDNGNNWSKTGLSKVCNSIVINKNDNIFAGTSDEGVFRSLDNGNNWAQINNGLTANFVTTLQADSSGDIFASAHNGGIFRTTDNGNNWTQINNGLSETDISAILINNSGKIFAGAGNSIFSSTDNGDSWTQSGSIGVSSFAINKSGNIFAASYGVYISTDNGNNWTQTGLIDRAISFLAINGNGYIFATASDGIYRSTDNGNNWTIKNSGLLTNDPISSIIISNYGDIFISTEGNGIFKSGDNGNSWAQINNGLTDTYVYSLAIDSSGYIYAGTFSGVFASIDNGNSWTQVNGSLKNTIVRCFTINNNGYIFAGTLGASVLRGSISEIIKPLFVYSLQMSSKSINMGEVLVGSSKDELVTITNTGNTTLNIASISSSNPYFSVTPTSLNIQSGTSAKDTIKFKPTTPGESSAKIIFISNAKSSPDTVIATGSGVISSFELSSRTINLGAVLVNSFKDTVISITNTSDDTLMISNVTSNNQAFSADPTILSIAPKSIAADTISFNPTQQGQVVAKFTLISNALNSPDSIIVSANGIISGIAKDNGLPKYYSLGQNYPNPFNPTTMIKYSVPRTSFVTIKIYDVLGKVVETLVNKEKPIGNYSVELNANELSSGIYFYRMQAGNFVETKKLILLK